MEQKYVNVSAFGLTVRSIDLEESSVGSDTEYDVTTRLTSYKLEN